MKYSSFIVAVFLVISSALQSMAKNIYISQNGNGTTNSLAWLNATANWGSGASQINPGDTVHLTGVITASIAIWGSGTPGNPITVLFDPNASCSAPTLVAPNYMWIYVAGGAHDLVIDGGVNGTLQCTQNGTGPAYGGTNLYQNGTVMGIVATPVNNLTIQNLTISNLYNRLPSSADPGVVGNATAMQLQGNNILVQNNTIYNTEDGIDYTYPNGVSSNLTIIRNTIIGFNHAICPGCSGANVNPIMYNVTIRSNRLDGMDYYEDKTGVITYYHRDGIFFINEANNPSSTSLSTYYTGLCSNIDISCNFIGPGVNPQTAFAGTFAIWLEGYNANQYVHARIYNNILTLKYPLSWGDGWIGAGDDVTDCLIANNTFVGGIAVSKGVTNYAGSGGIAGGGAANNLILNNLQYNCTGTIEMGAAPTTASLSSFNLTAANVPLFANALSDYNILPVGAGVNAFEIACVQNWTPATGGSYVGGIFNTLAQWQALSPRFDPHSTTKIPLLDTNSWIPLSTDTVAKGGGTNLSAYFSTDYYGNPRSATGNWDIGACAFAVPPLTAPTGFHIVSQ